jgi:hypothetical protein
MSLGTRVLGSIFVSLIVTLPIALSRSTSDTDEGLVVVPVRADVVDATKKAVAVVATGTSNADARLAIDGRE